MYVYHIKECDLLFTPTHVTCTFVCGNGVLLRYYTLCAIGYGLAVLYTISDRYKLDTYNTCPSCIRIHQADGYEVDTLHARNEIVHYEACMQAGRISTIYRHSIERKGSLKLSIWRIFAGTVYT